MESFSNVSHNFSFNEVCLDPSLHTQCSLFEACSFTIGSVGFFHHSVPVQSPWCLLGLGVAQEVEVECDRLAEMSIQLSMQLFTEERLGVEGVV